eukprot:1266788-Prymnesium_polylepis.1
MAQRPAAAPRQAAARSDARGGDHHGTATGVTDPRRAEKGRVDRIWIDLTLLPSGSSIRMGE